ncbi:MAG TPA: hypothetical protein VFB63_02470, partial [Bryobacteraceae bacterium]|nr:hypothetical protein [Bryobacteraceae bacterium]
MLVRSQIPAAAAALRAGYRKRRYRDESLASGMSGLYAGTSRPKRLHVAPFHCSRFNDGTQSRFWRAETLMSICW